MLRRSPLLPLLLLAVSLDAQSGTNGSSNWPDWRGPNGDGSAEPSADPPLRWSREENVAWHVELPGDGKSTPIVWGERIFVLAAVPGERASEETLAARTLFEGQLTEAPEQLYAFHALAFDRRDGKLLWDTVLTQRLPVAGIHPTNGYASSSPVTDGDGLWISLGSYGVHALDAKTGALRWSHELGPQEMRRGWGEASSPALVGDTLIVVADQEGPSRILGLDKRTGEPVWTRERDEVSTWNTPCIVRTGELTQVIVNGTVAARSYDAATGELLWECAGQTVNAIPTPVSDGRTVVVTSGYQGSNCLALDLAARGDLAETPAVRWSHRGGTPYVPSPVLVGRRLYFTSGNSPLLTCLDYDTGKVLLDRERLELGNLYASPLAAAGRLYLVDREGTTLVLRHGEELEVLARNELGETIDASPVAIGDTLYLRSTTALWALREADRAPR